MDSILTLHQISCLIFLYLSRLWRQHILSIHLLDLGKRRYWSCSAVHKQQTTPKNASRLRYIQRFHLFDENKIPDWFNKEIFELTCVTGCVCIHRPTPVDMLILLTCTGQTRTCRASHPLWWQDGKMHRWFRWSYCTHRMTTSSMSCLHKQNIY